MHYLKSQIVSDRTCSSSSDEDGKEKSREPDYDEDKDQLDIVLNSFIARYSSFFLYYAFVMTQFCHDPV
jgi:hypothetical protein